MSNRIDPNTLNKKSKEDSFMIRPRFADLGWGFIVAWGISVIFSDVFSFGEQSNLGFFWVSSMVGTSCGLIFLFFCKLDFKINNVSNAFQFFALSVMILGTVSLIISLYVDEMLATALQILGGLISSLGTAIFTVLWGARFSALNMQQIESYAAYSLLLAFGCYAFILFVPQVIGFVFVLLLPILTLYCLKKSASFDEYSQQKDITRTYDGLSFSYKSFTRLGLGIIACTTVVSLFWGLVNSGTVYIPHRLFEASVLSGMIVAILLAVYLSWFSRYIHLSTLYRWVCPLVIASFALVSLKEPGFTLFACLFIFAGQAMLNLLTFVYFAELSKKVDVSPIKIFGLGRFFQEIGFLFGSLISIALSQVISSGHFNVDGTLLFSSAFLIVFVMIAISDQEKLAFTLKEADFSDKTNSHKRSVDELLQITSNNISIKYGLTNRESEILGYLVKGYSLPYIRNELHISQSTIDTHVRHIYSKLGIHSRKELLSLVHAADNMEKTGN